MSWDKDYVELGHSYMFEVENEKFFTQCRSHLPSILHFLQDAGEIKGYSLDNCQSIGSKDDGFIRGRLAFRTDTYVELDPLLEAYLEDLNQEEENTNDRT